MSAADSSLTDTPQADYRCPGESHSISRAVHLARLAAFYPPCRECPHRHDTGQLPRELVGQFTQTLHRTPRSSWISGEGVRAIYLNELDRSAATKWAAALAQSLWEDVPLMGRTDEMAPLLDADSVPARRSGPSVVVGYDERPAAPDIFAGVILGLRRMGCQVIDIGLTTRPCFRFAVHHLAAAAGVYITGAGCDPAWIGFDVAGRAGIPFDPNVDLPRLEVAAQQDLMRPTRLAGSVRSFQAATPYRAGLVKHFHALRPLSIACGQPGRLGPRWLEQLFAGLPCRLVPLPLPVRRRTLSDPADADVLRVAERVREQGLHLGIVIDDDGERCAVIDESGGLLSHSRLGSLLATRHFKDQPGGTVAAATQFVAELEPLSRVSHGKLLAASESATSLARSVEQRQAGLGIGADHRCWFDEGYPASDATLTLAHVLQALSWSDEGLSVVAGSGG